VPEKQAYKLEKRVAAEKQLLKSPASFSFSYFDVNAYVVIYQAFNPFLRQLLSPRVRLLIGAPNMLGGKMGINLRGRYVSVSQ